ncbi:MAG: metallophosphoesterase family protein [Candidatus Hydrogenedentes bacterium]|nr:metallophosphoesterase family protein [Candidatus Hydrogenedentota bacterium]
MLIAIVADLHANLEATQAVFKEIDIRKPDKIVCLGDLTGYNANPNEVVDFVREREIPCVMGNHDAAVCGLEDPWFFRAAAKKAIEWQFDKLSDDNRRWLSSCPEQVVFRGNYLGVHGSPSSRDDYIIDWLDAMRQLEFLNGREVNACFFGHSHRPSFFSEKGNATPGNTGNIRQLHPSNRYFINPGAVGQPRDRDPRAAFGLFDLQRMTFEFCRVEYDIETCQKKIMQAGLPGELARRLARGK